MSGNTGHGHAWERPDGVKARCGGPGICTECAMDAMRMREGNDYSTPEHVAPLLKAKDDWQARAVAAEAKIERIKLEAKAIGEALGERGLVDLADDVRMLTKI